MADADEPLSKKLAIVLDLSKGNERQKLVYMGILGSYTCSSVVFEKGESRDQKKKLQDYCQRITTAEVTQCSVYADTQEDCSRDRTK